MYRISLFSRGLHLAISFANHTQYQFKHTLQAAYDLLPHVSLPPNLAKRRRSLLPFIGKIASSLFGTATEDDIKALAAHVQAISKSQSQMLSGFQVQTEHMSSFMTLSQERMNNFEELLKQQYADLFQTILTDRQWLQQRDENLTFLLYRVFSKLYDYLLLQNQVQE